MEDRFYKAVFPPEARVCGRWLKPLTLWQELILEAIESPFATGRGNVHAEDVLLFCRVTECVYPEMPIFTPRRRDWWWRRRMARDRTRLLKEAVTVSRWLREVNSAPEFWEPTGEKGVGISGPPIWAMAWKLVISCGYTIADAMNETAGRAWWATAQVDELKGDGKKFAWLADVVDPLPDLNEASEEEVMRQAERDLPPAALAKWKRARAQGQKGPASAKATARQGGMN